MRLWPWSTLLAVGCLLGALTIGLGGCSDDDDDDEEDKESDFENMDDDDTSTDDDTGEDPDFSEDPATGACGCDGCGGCASKMDALDGAGLLDDFAGLNVDFGADEWGTDLELAIAGDVPVADLVSFDQIRTDAVACADAGANCAFECDAVSCMAACGEQVFDCVIAAETDFAARAEAEGATCAGYLDCAMDRAFGDDAAACESAYPACESLSEVATTVSCFAGLGAEFSLIETPDDLAGVFASYVSCLP